MREILPTSTCQNISGCVSLVEKSVNCQTFCYWVLSVCKTPIISKVWRLGDDARISSGHCGLRWGIIGQNSPCFYLPLYIVFVEIHLHRYIWWNANTQLEHIAMWSQKVHYWPEWPLPYLPSLSAQLAVTKPHKQPSQARMTSIQYYTIDTYNIDCYKTTWEGPDIRMAGIVGPYNTVPRNNITYLQNWRLQNHTRGTRYKDGWNTVGRFRDIRPACEEPSFLTFISILHASNLLVFWWPFMIYLW